MISGVEALARGNPIAEPLAESLAQAAYKQCHPLINVPYDHDYRREMVRVCTLRGLKAIREGQEHAGMPTEPILLWGRDLSNGRVHTSQEFPSSAIETTINGKNYSFNSGHDKTLLRLLREEANLIEFDEGLEIERTVHAMARSFAEKRWVDVR